MRAWLHDRWSMAPFDTTLKLASTLTKYLYGTIAVRSGLADYSNSQGPEHARCLIRTLPVRRKRDGCMTGEDSVSL